MKLLNRTHPTMKTTLTRPVLPIVRADAAFWRTLMTLLCGVIFFTALPVAHAAPPELMTWFAVTFELLRLTGP